MIEIRMSELYVDGEKVRRVLVSLEYGGSGVYRLKGLHEESSKLLATYSFFDFPPTLEHIKLQHYPVNIKYTDKRGVFIHRSLKKERGVYIRPPLGKDENDGLNIYFYIGGDALTVWQSPYTFIDYVYEMNSRLKNHEAIHGIEMYDRTDTAISYRIYYDSGIRRDKRIEINIDEIESSRIHSMVVIFKISPNKILAEEIERTASVIQAIHDEVEEYFASIASSNSVTALFKDFPKEVRSYCEQYLVYFTRFLQDLGVETTSELKHEAGKVLFTVTPTEEVEALEKIKAALDVYLRLPSSPVSGALTGDIAVQRLEYQVAHLQNNLRLAAAELQAKNTLTNAQQVIIKVQNALLNGEIYLTPTEQIESENKIVREEDRETLIDERVALARVHKDKEAEIDLAERFRYLQDLFKDREEKEKSFD